MFKNKHFFRKQFAYACLSVLCALGMGQIATAAGTSKAATTSLQTVVQSYQADSNVQKGMIVQLDSKDPSKVVQNTLKAIDKMQGVVIAPSDAAVTLSSSATGNQIVYVATSGRYEVLVDNQNGKVSVGDYVTISSLAGVGMRADTKESQMLGRAAGNFDGTHNVESTTTVKDQKGHSRTITLGRIPVDIGISPNPLALRVNSVPSALQHASLLIANKQVSTWRIYTGMLIIIGCIIIAGTLLYGGVRNGMVAIGRNPLARGSIMGNLLQVIITSIIIFIIGLFSVYLLLKL